jgi:molybdopterin synthase sulfur carrier subunit
MMITVKLFANFREGRFKIDERTYPAGACVADVLRSLEIEESDVGMLFNRGRHVEADFALSEGDVLAIVPLVGGG